MTATMKEALDVQGIAQDFEFAARKGFDYLQRWALDVSSSPLASVFVNCIKTSLGQALDEWEGELSTRYRWLADFLPTFCEEETICWAKPEMLFMPETGVAFRS